MSSIFLIIATSLMAIAAAHTPSVPKPKLLTVAATHEIPAPPFDWYGSVISDEDGNLFFRLATAHFPDPVVMRLARRSGDPAIMKVEQDRDHEWQLRAYNVTPSGRFFMLCADIKSKKQALFEFDDDGQVKNTTVLDIPSHVDVMDIAVFEHGESFMAGYYNSEASESLRGKGYAALFTEGGIFRRNIKDVVPQTELAKVPTQLHEGAATIGADGYLYLLTGKGIVVINSSGALVRFLAFSKPPNSTAIQLAYSQGWCLIGFAEAPGRGPIKMHLRSVGRAHRRSHRLLRSVA